MTTTQCACQTFFFGTYGPDGSAESFEDYGTECTQTTGRTFAQGHDAKLVGFLVRADLAGEEIARVEGGVRMTYQNAIHAAASISPALGAKADAMMTAAVARLAKKAVKPAMVAAAVAQLAKKAVKPATAPKAAKAAPAVEEPTTRHATVKIGRWTYRAAIVLATGEAHYSSKLGADKIAPAGTWSEVN